MDIIQLPRRGGKTTYMIERSARTGEVIVCFDSNEADQVLNFAKYMNLVIPKPTTFAVLMGVSQRGRDTPGYIIDNLDIMITRLTGEKINLATVSTDLNQPT